MLTGETDRVGTATFHLLRLLATAIIAGVYLALAVGLSPTMTGLAVLCAAGLGWLLRGRLRTSRETGRETAQAMRNLYGVMADHLGGMREARIYGAEQHHVADFERLIRQNRQTVLRAVENMAAVRHWFELGAVVTLSAILYVSIEVLALPTAQVLLLIFLFARLMPRFSEMIQSYHHFVHLMPAFLSVVEMERRCRAAAEPTPHAPGNIEFRREVRLERVSFGYDTDPVIREFDMRLRFGEIVALVGPSGAGKSTVADLIMGLVRPDEGRVLVDGVPLGPETARAWRARIGYVGQDPFLFHDTVRANLLFARPSATEAELFRALELAAAREFVSRLPHGLDTVVGERGMALSGGQRQRLALARAFLRDPSLLILDEATSFLDAENERRILESLERLRGRMTVLIISHRRSTIRGADVVYELCAAA
ncbi:MAG: ABC transporter ATP-binding protein [Ardenticatenia bacterium]|nr:ABC transporter ATP-binding protein [Ardenticatenia bacterium]